MTPEQVVDAFDKAFDGEVIAPVTYRALLRPALAGSYQEMAHRAQDQFDEYEREIAALRAALAEYEQALARIAAPPTDRDGIGVTARAIATAALAATPPAEGLDVERLTEAMDEAYEYAEEYVPALPFVDDVDGFWRPFAAKVLAALAPEQPE